MRTPDTNEVAPLGEVELAELQDEKKRHRAKGHDYATYGMHTHVAEPTPGHRSDNLRHSLVRPRKARRGSAIPGYVFGGGGIVLIITGASDLNGFYIMVGLFCLAAGVLLIAER